MFDLDGTLANTGPDLADAVNFTRAHFHLAPLALQTIYANVGRGVEHLVRHSLTIKGPEHFHEALRVFVVRYEAHLLDNTALYPGVRAVLDPPTPAKGRRAGSSCWIRVRTRSDIVVVPGDVMLMAFLAGCRCAIAGTARRRRKRAPGRV